MTRHDELCCIYSDMYKDTYGFRPRHVDYSKISEDELNEMIDLLSVELTRTIEREKQEKKIAALEFEVTVNNLIKSGAGDRPTALRWLHDACDANGDWGYVEYTHGLSYGYLTEGKMGFRVLKAGA